MKKENLFGLIFYLLVFGIAILYGFTVLQNHYQYSYFSKTNPAILFYGLYIIGSVFAGVLAAGLLEGLGHLLGAKVGGYNIISYCLFYFTFYKNEGKWKFKFAGYDGLTGETKIVPNYKKKNRPNPYPFILYGSFFNTAFIAISLYLFFSWNKSDTRWVTDIAYLCLTMAIVVFLIFIYNIIPIKLDSLTDGYLLTKAKNIDSFNKTLEANNVGEVVYSDENGESKVEPAADHFIPEVALTDVYLKLANEEYDEAFNLLSKIDEVADELTVKGALSAKAQYIYAYIFSKDKQEVISFYEDKVSFALRRELSNSNFLPVIRTYLLTAGVLDGSLSECLLACKKVVKAYKAVPNNLRHAEVVLFNRALNKVKEVHPKWEELDNYQLYE